MHSERNPAAQKLLDPKCLRPEKTVPVHPTTVGGPELSEGELGPDLRLLPGLWHPVSQGVQVRQVPDAQSDADLSDGRQ